MVTEANQVLWTEARRFTYLLNNGVVTLEIHAVKGVSVVRKISIQRYFRFSWTVRTKHDFSFITNRTGGGGRKMNWNANILCIEKLPSQWSKSPKAVRRSVFLTIGHCILSTELKKRTPSDCFVGHFAPHRLFLLIYEALNFSIFTKKKQIVLLMLMYRAEFA